MRMITLTVPVGNETQSVTLTVDEWDAVKSGRHLLKNAPGFYEGQEFTYAWCFNDPQFPDCSLVVLHDDAEGFLGSFNDAFHSE